MLCDFTVDGRACVHPAGHPGSHLLFYQVAPEPESEGLPMQPFEIIVRFVIPAPDLIDAARLITDGLNSLAMSHEIYATALTLVREGDS